MFPQDARLDKSDGENLPPKRTERRPGQVPEPDGRVEKRACEPLDRGLFVTNRYEMEMKGFVAGIAVETIVVVAIPLPGEDSTASDLVHSVSR